MSIIIAGGGMAGATLALALSALSGGRCAVTLVEALAPGADAHPGFDARAIALAHGTCQQLAQIGVWPALASCATAIRQVQISDRGHGGALWLDADAYDLPALGQVIPLHQAGARLFQLLASAPGVTLFCPATLARVERRVDGVTAWLEDGRCLQGRLLVAADGASSPLAQMCGMRWHSEAYEQTALIATLASSEAHQDAPLSVLRRMGRWRCCRWRRSGAHWSGACRRCRRRRSPGGIRRRFSTACSRPLAGVWGVLRTAVGVIAIR